MKPTKSKTTYTSIGLMSGTSLDGLDVALCSFNKHKKHWDYKILDAKTYPYNHSFKQRLINSPLLNAGDFWKLHVEFGAHSAKIVNTFLKGRKNKVDLIASHGHTIFHQPQNGFTC